MASLSGVGAVRFYWEGPLHWKYAVDSDLQVKTIDLFFKNANTNLSVALPEHADANRPLRLIQRVEDQTTYTEAVRFMADDVHHLSLKIGIFTPNNPVHRVDQIVPVEIVDAFAPDINYRLI